MEQARITGKQRKIQVLGGGGLKFSKGSFGVRKSVLTSLPHLMVSGKNKLTAVDYCLQKLYRESFQLNILLNSHV